MNQQKNTPSTEAVQCILDEIEYHDLMASAPPADPLTEADLELMCKYYNQE